MNKKARTRKLTAKQSARLGAYLAAGVGASMASSSDAEAAIVFFDVNPDITLTGTGTANFGNITITGATGTYTLGSTASNYFGINLYNSYFTAGKFYGLGNGSIEWGFLGEASGVKLAQNTSISGASPWRWGGYAYGLAGGGYGYWASGGSGYAPLRINLGGGNYNYGWAALSYNFNGTNSTAGITGFAFQGDPNVAILAGDQGGPAAVPEPGTWAAAALLAGGATFLRWRRRRDEAQKEAA